MFPPFTASSQFTRKLLGIVENTINSLLQLDPETTEELSTLQGKIIAIEIKGLDLTVFARPRNGEIHLTTETELAEQVRLRGTPFGFMRMLTARERHKAAFSGDVEIIGDLAISQQLQRVIRRLDIDWEELLSKAVGDVMAHQIGNAVRGLTGWGRQTRVTLEKNLAEYAKHESQILPTEDEVESFSDDVDALRLDADRLEQRVKRLVAQNSNTRSGE